MDNNGVSLWNSLLEIIKGKINPNSFETWFVPTRLISAKDNSINISVPNNFSKEWMEKHYISLIKEVLLSMDIKDKEIIFVAEEQSKTVIETISYQTNVNPQKPTFSSSLIIGSPLNPKYTFNNFIVGHSNRFAHGACTAVAEAPAKSYNPLFIYGGVGLGKTHLLHAVGHFLRKEDPTLKVAYLTSEQFLNEMIMGLTSGKIVDFRNKYRYVDILLIDDIQFLEGKESMQEEFFHTFNVLHSANRQIVATCDSKPQELKIEERLKSRFEMGLIADIGVPDLETRVAIIKKKGESEKVLLTDDICLYIANMVEDDVRELEGYLTKILAYSSITKSKITMELIKECLKNDMPALKEKKVTIEDIKEAIIKYYKLKPSDMITKKRTQPVAFARQVAMFIAREHTDMSLPEIGQNFGGRDHSTVIHAYETIQNKKETDLVFGDELKRIIDSIKSS